MFKIDVEVDKIAKVGNMVASVEATIKSPAHINDLITVSHRMIAHAFVVHMTREGFSNPEKYEHVYEWGRTGDPNAKLWKHHLRGTGANRVTTFEFVASKTAVPLTPEKEAVGVQRNHIFVWKAPVLEYGLPVKVYPKLASTLVMDYPKRTGHLTFTKRVILIEKQGSEASWGSFTNAFQSWYSGPGPMNIINNSISPVVHKATKQALNLGIRRMGRSAKSKTFKIAPVGLDKNFMATLKNSLRVNYIAAAAQRRVDVGE